MAFEELGPNIRITVEGQALDVEITDFVISCEVEQSQELAWKITLDVLNVQNDAVGVGFDGTFLFTDSKVFQPGNTIEVEMGYGQDMEFVGAGIIQKWLPTFPDNGSPKLRIVAYDGRVLMMENEEAQEAQAWEDTPHSDVIQAMADKYGFQSEIEPTNNPEKRTFKKAGRTDWALVQGLARLHGFYTAVEWNRDSSTWVLKWGPVENVWPQEKQYTFRYSVAGQENTLLSFSPEMAIKGLPTSVKLRYFDKDSRTWEAVEFKEEKDGETLKYSGNGSGSPKEEILSSYAFRFATGGIAVEVVPKVHFDTPEAAQRFAEAWFIQNRDQFITGRGRTVGLEFLSVGHIHILEGIGTQLSGEWQFTTVRHMYGQNGYKTAFFSHKVVK